MPASFLLGCGSLRPGTRRLRHMLLGAAELRASAPLGACAASSSAAQPTAFAADDARPRSRATRGGDAGVGFADPAVVRGNSYPGRGGRRQKHLAGSLWPAGLPGVCRREQAAISALLQADHRCADLGARQRRCDGERRQEELIRAPRAAASGIEAAALTSGVLGMPLPARRRAPLFGGKVPRAGTASRSPSEPHEVPTWRGDQRQCPVRLPVNRRAIRRCPVICGGRMPALFSTPVRIAQRGPLPTGKLGRLALAPRWDTPHGETCSGCEASPIRRFQGSAPRSQVALLDLAFQVRSRVRQ